MSLQVILAIAIAGAASASAIVMAHAPQPETVAVHIHYSRFVPNLIEVPAEVPITFVLHNDDPIDHEWIVGSDALHAIHRAGTEAVHTDRANEVSLPAFSTRTTTLTFAPGVETFVCHFPGHEAYGMIGIVIAR